MVNYNKSLVEPYSNLTDAAFLNYRSDICLIQENENVESELHEIELMNRQKQIALMKPRVV